MEQVALLAFLIFAAAVLYSSVGHAGASDLYPKMLGSSLRHSCPQDVPTRATPPVGGSLKRHRATELVIYACTLKVLNVLRIGTAAHYTPDGFCASGAVCSSLLHVCSHDTK